MMTEFGLIEVARRLADTLPAHQFEGIGDDCAVLPIGGGEALCFTADLVVEEVHFLREAMTPEEVARKALHVNLSDVASMGVRPVATLLSVALPRAMMQGEWAERFMQGYIAASAEAGVALIGGDTTASKSHIAINVTAIGRGAESHLKRRSEARVGDVVAVSGPLGGSAAGLRHLLAGQHDTPQAATHRTPTARIEEGVWLGGEEAVHAMMDLSDGLASDLRHILERSSVSAEVEVERIPTAEGATLEEALCGGEDYQLLLTLDAARFEEVAARFEAQFGTPLHAVGHILAAEEEPTLHWKREGATFFADWQGFRHY